MNEEIMRVTATDGRSFDATVVLPAGGRGPGIVLFQEIFGVNDFQWPLGIGLTCPARKQLRHLRRQPG